MYIPTKKKQGNKKHTCSYIAKSKYFWVDDIAPKKMYGHPFCNFCPLLQLVLINFNKTPALALEWHYQINVEN